MLQGNHIPNDYFPILRDIRIHIFYLIVQGFEIEFYYSQIQNS